MSGAEQLFAVRLNDGKKNTSNSQKCFFLFIYLRVVFGLAGAEVSKTKTETVSYCVAVKR